MPVGLLVLLYRYRTTRQIPHFIVAANEMVAPFGLYEYNHIQHFSFMYIHIYIHPQAHMKMHVYICMLQQICIYRDNSNFLPMPNKCTLAQI